MKVGFMFECGPDGPDVQVCRHQVYKHDPTIEFVPSTLDNKKNWMKIAGRLPKSSLRNLDPVDVMWITDMQF